MGKRMGDNVTGYDHNEQGFQALEQSEEYLNPNRGHLRHVSETPLLFSDDDEEEEEEKRKEAQENPSCHEPESDLHYPDEVWKTLLTFLWLCTGMVVTTISLIVTNERHEYSAPLPDLVLDMVTYQPAGVTVSEMIMVTSILITFITTMMHTHRCIILRRIFFIVGLMYFYRAITMSVTVLPKPDPTWDCPKQNTTLKAGDVWEKLKSISGHG